MKPPRIFCTVWFAAVLAMTTPLTHAVTILRVTAAEGTPPKFLAFQHNNQTAVTGLCIDILRAIERIEPDIRFVGDQNWMPLARVEAELAAGIQDASCLIKSPEREAKMFFVEPALFQTSYSLAVRADDNVQIRRWEDVPKLGDNSTILAMKSSGALGRAKNAVGAQIRIDSDATTPELNLRKLIAGRGRFFYHSTPALRREIRRTGLKGKVRVISPPMEITYNHLVLGKNVPPEVAEKIRQAILQLISSGELTALVHKWEND